MKSTNKIGYLRIAFLAIFTELVLILIQFGFLNLYVSFYPENELAFTEAYMKSFGLFVFQAIGFLAYLIVIYLLSKRIDKNILRKVTLFVIVGGLIELSFYLLVMEAKYEGAYLYSIFSKFVGAAFGMIIYSIGTKKIKSHDSFI